MHFAVEVPPDRGANELRDWIGGCYEHQYSCNPIFEAEFTELPKHPITTGVKPFAIKDEWYFCMRFKGGVAGNEPGKLGELVYTPILVTTPSDKVRNGPYVYPKGPYKHIQEATGRPEAVMWAVERPDGGRGFGFTGGHFHDNFGHADFRKVVLNALAWVAKAGVPAGGVESALEGGELDRNLDPKK